MALYQQTDEKLKADEANFRFLYDHSPIPYHSLDSEGHILEVNESWLSKLGYKRHDVIGRWFTDFLAPEYIKSFEENFSKLQETEIMLQLTARRNTIKMEISNGLIVYL